MQIRGVTAFLFLSVCAFAQGGFYQDRAEGRLINGNALVAIPGAMVTVCSDQACVSPVNIYSNADLAVGHLIGTSTTADANGNFSFFVLPGQYFCQIAASGFSTAINPCQASITMPNVAGVVFVDGVKYATIDAAITGAGAGPAIVIIPSTYAGAESANLVTVDGQTRYCGQDNITIWDMRVGVEHNYNQNWGGTVLGSLSRQAITQCKVSPIHTTSASLVTNYVTGAMPPDLGTVAGLTTQVTIYGTATPQAGGHVAGFEAYTELVPTNVATWADVRAATFSVNIDRTTAKGNITDANGVYAGPCINSSTSGATITNCYSFHAGQPTVGTARNYSAFFEGSMLMSNNVNFDMIDGSAAPQHILTPTPSNDLFLRGLADTHGVIFATAAGATEVQVNSTGMKVAIGVNGDGGGFKHLRGTTGCTTAASVGATCTTVVTWTTTFADANYTAGCSGDLVTSGVPVNGGLTAKSATAVTFQTVAVTASAAKFTAIDCWGYHD